MSLLVLTSWLCCDTCGNNIISTIKIYTYCTRRGNTRNQKPDWIVILSLTGITSVMAEVNTSFIEQLLGKKSPIRRYSRIGFRFGSSFDSNGFFFADLHIRYAWLRPRSHRMRRCSCSQWAPRKNGLLSIAMDCSHRTQARSKRILKQICVQICFCNLCKLGLTCFAADGYFNSCWVFFFFFFFVQIPRNN